MTAPLDEKTEITVGMRVEKFTGEARWVGVVVSEYLTTKGMRRFVVDVEPQGFQMIAVPSQLRPALSAVALPDELEIVANLRSDAAQLLRMSEATKFGEDLSVRVAKPDLLISNMVAAADAISQAHSTIAALRAEIGELKDELEDARAGACITGIGRFAVSRKIEAVTVWDRENDTYERYIPEARAEAEVKRLTEEKEALRAQRDAALSLMETALLSADPYRHIRAACQALSGSKE